MKNKIAWDDGNTVVLEGLKPCRETIVFVSGAYSADTEEGVAANVAKAKLVGEKLIRAGYAPIVPQTMYYGMENAGSWQDFMDICYTLLEQCHAIVMMKDYKNSPGACDEYLAALAVGLDPYEIIDIIPTVC